MLAFQADDMLDGVRLRMIGEEKDARSIVEPDVILLARDDIAVTQGQAGLNRKVVIVDAIVFGEINIVVIHAAEVETKRVVKLMRRGRNAGVVISDFNAWAIFRVAQVFRVTEVFGI